MSAKRKTERQQALESSLLYQMVSNPSYGQPITTLEELAAAAMQKRSVIGAGTQDKRVPAAIVLCWQGAMILNQFRKGRFLYNRQQSNSIYKKP